MAYQLTELQEKWLKALESGEYEQTQNYLYDGYGYCCLGVLCKVDGRDFSEGQPDEGDGEETVWKIDGDHYKTPPEDLCRKAKLRGPTGMIEGAQLKKCGFLTHANDDGATFAEIAAFIRANPEKVFLP